LCARAPVIPGKSTSCSSEAELISTVPAPGLPDFNPSFTPAATSFSLRSAFAAATLASAAACCAPCFTCFVVWAACCLICSSDGCWLLQAANHNDAANKQSITANRIAKSPGFLVLRKFISASTVVLGHTDGIICRQRGCQVSFSAFRWPCST